MEYALTVHQPLALVPNTISCNWKCLWNRPAHRVGVVYVKPASWVHSTYDEFTAEIQTRDEYGPYTVFGSVRRKRIDATCLRACRIFNDIGSSILYGENTFIFNPTGPSKYASPPSMAYDGTIIRPSMPSISKGGYIILHFFDSYTQSGPRMQASSKLSN